MLTYVICEPSLHSQLDGDQEGIQMAKKKSKKKGSSGEILVVQSKVREYLKSQGDYNIGGDVFEAVSARIERILERAAERAAANNRKTIQGKDI